jgi:molybdenum cofactor cytidylyltransferase
MVYRVALAALNTSAQVVVVTGAHRELVESCIAGLRVERVFNADWADGMGGSIACGIAALDECDSAIIALADQPLVGRAEFAALIAAHAQAPECIVAAKFEEVLGPPCLFPRAYFEELAELRGERGARALLQRRAQQVAAVAMPGAAFDIDTPQDAAAFTSRA